MSEGALGPGAELMPARQGASASASALARWICSTLEGAPHRE